MTKNIYRLPSHVRPISYDIELRAHPSRPDFSGTVTTELVLARESPRIEMHARDLRLSDATLFWGGKEAPCAIAVHGAEERVVFTPAEPVPPGTARLRVAFSGPLSPSMHGLYLAQDGHERAVCTQCEATDARAIFPCFDEPEFKATLRWTIHTGADVVALCNAAKAGSTRSGEQVTHSFAATRPVSSYLAAVAIGDFESAPEESVRGVPLRVFAVRGKAAQTHFAQRFTARLLPWYEEYFAYPYPYGKYDQVAVPGFDAGAMENVGLVLFRQNLLLMDPKTASWRQEKLIARVIAHEFAHMWFGNLVTMRWWDDLWLNEAFAEWMAHKATHAVEPSYEVWNDFQDDKNRALQDDALPTTHPIWAPVATPAEAIEMFDSITYQKGCAVMRMLENFLGEAPFRDGLRAYMSAFAEGNAAGPDLWHKLQESSGQPVGEVMKSWVVQPGFPLVDVKLVEGNRLHLSQNRFFSSPEDSRAPNDQRWNVPMVVRFEDDGGPREHRFILDRREQVEALPGLKGALKWCYANAGEIGFYRCSHDAELGRRLAESGRLSPAEQMGYIEDQWALLRNGRSTIERFLQVLEGFAATGDHNVLRVLADRVGALDLFLRDSDNWSAREGLRAWVRRRFAAGLKELGYTPRPREPQNDVQRRALYIHLLASIGRVPEVIAEAERFFEIELADPRAVDPNLAGVFVAIAAKFGDEARFGRFVEAYKTRKSRSATPQETLRYLHTLAAFRKEGLAERTLGLIDDGTVPQEAIGTVLSQLLHARRAQEQAWAYLKAGFPALRARVGDMGLSRLVEAVGHLRHRHREDVVAFFQANPPQGAERALARALTAMDQREELRQRITPGLLAYFLSQNQESAG